MRTHVWFTLERGVLWNLPRELSPAGLPSISLDLCSLTRTPWFMSTTRRRHTSSLFSNHYFIYLLREHIRGRSLSIVWSGRSHPVCCCYANWKIHHTSRRWSTWNNCWMYNKMYLQYPIGNNLSFLTYPWRVCYTCSPSVACRVGRTEFHNYWRSSR